MTWIISLFTALLTGALGLFCAGAIMSACVKWYHISSFEGGSGYAVVFTALLGGIAGLAIGLITARIVAAGGSPGFFKAMGYSWGTVLCLSVIATFFCWVLADIPPEANGRRLNLEVEIRLPAGTTNVTAADPKETFLELGSVVNHRQRASQRGELKTAEAREENGRWIVPGEVFIFTSRGLRSLTGVIDKKTCAGFIIPLPPRPTRGFGEWSQWFPVNLNGTPWPEDKPSYRFRVQPIFPLPPPPDPAVVEAEQFAALKPEAPLADWLPYMRYGAPEERVQAVMQVVASRPAELAQCIRSTNGTTRELALSAVTQPLDITPEISAAVLAEGREIAEGVRRFNAMPSTDPEFYNVQLEWRSRFSDWHRAWWSVHQRTGADGRPPVQEILDLAQVRAKDTSIREVVVNAQAHLNGLKQPEAATR